MSTHPTHPGESSPPAAAIRVSGRPSPEELAVLVVVLSALGGGEPAPSGHGRSAWADPAWHLVGPRSHVGGWRASALPH